MTVITTADSGAGSLRSAIGTVNAGKASTVDFDIPKSQSSGGIWTIGLKSARPAIHKSALVDGFQDIATTASGNQILGNSLTVIQGYYGISGSNAATPVIKTASAPGSGAVARYTAQNQAPCISNSSPGISR